MKLQVSTATAKVLAKALPLALEKPNGRHYLTYVEVSNIGGRLTFSATNGYIAFRIGVDSWGDLPADPFTVQGKELCKALGDAVKGAGKYIPTIHLSYFYDVSRNSHVVTVASDTTFHTVMCADISFPPLSAILADNNESEAGVVLNGNFLADIATGATLCAGSEGLVTVETLNTRKAGKITAESEEIRFTGVIMPCRQDSKVGK